MSAQNLSTNCTEQNTLVFTTHEHASKWIFTDLEKNVYLTCFVIIVVLGLVGNFSFMYAVAKVPKLRTTVNLYLVNLALADVLFLGMNAFYYVAMFVHSSVKENIPYDWPASCSVIFGSATVGYYASMGIIVMLSIERFLAICHPLRHRYLQNKKRTIQVIFAVWVMSIGPGTVLTLRYSKHTTVCVKWPDDAVYETMPDTVNICMTLIEGKQFSTTSSLIFLTAFFVPLILITITNSKIVATLKRKNQTLKRSIGFINIRRQVTRTCLIVVTIFFVLKLPLRTISALYIVRDFIGKDFFNKSVEQMVLIIGRMLVLMNSAINSLVYILVSQHYREGFMEAFGLSFSKRELSLNGNRP